MPAASRTGRIPSTEWPTIVARRQNGETYAAIARDYDVTGPAIKYIVDKALAEGVTAPEAPETDAPETGTLTIADAQPTDAEPADAHPDAAEAATAETAPAPAADTPLARRLLDAVGGCAALIEAAERRGAGIDDEIKDALHQVRRAVAAIEIEMSRSAAPAHHPVRQTARARPAPTQATTPRARTQDQPAPDMPSNDGGGFGTHVVQGTVKFFHADKGFGFVIPDDGGSDIYVPLKALRGSGLDTLQSEQRVRVSVMRGAKGLEAREIEPIAA